MFFVERGRQIMALVNAVLDSVGALASGNLSAAAEAIEGALARAIPVAISFLSSLLGLGNVSEKVQEIIQSVRGIVDRALDAVFNSRPVQMVAGFIRGAIDKVRRFITGEPAETAQAPEPGADSSPQEGGEGTVNGEDNPELSAGLAAIHAQERRLADDRGISHEEAQEIANAVKTQHPVFSSITPIEGSRSWDYEYVIQTTKEEGDKPKEGLGNERLLAELGESWLTRLMDELGEEKILQLFEQMNSSTFHKLGLKDTLNSVGLDDFINLVKTNGVEAMVKYGAEALKKVDKSDLDAASNISSTFMSLAKLQKKWKHAVDFGVSSAWKAKDIDEHQKFLDSLNEVVSNADEVYVGPYHGFPWAVHFFGGGGKVVITELSGAFISGWGNAGNKLAGVRISAPPNGVSTFRVR